MPASNLKHPPETLLPKIASLAAVVGCYMLVEWISSFHWLARLVPLPASLSTQLAGLFEHQVWQFGVGMVAITFLSRGHLWSFGINSSGIRLSMSILLKFYAAAAVVMAGLVCIPLWTSAVVPAYFVGMSRVDKIVWVLYEWMAAAVADEIFFHGLFQTLLLKYWKEKIVVKSFELPVGIVATSIVFAACRTNIPVYGGHFLEYSLALVIGVYGGIVYYRTRSLLTPMLSQAFFYGLPFVIRFIFLALSAR